MKQRNVFLALGIGLVLLSASFYFRSHWDSQRSEEDEQMLASARVLRERAMREAEASEQASLGQARREAWEAIRSAIEEARQARVPPEPVTAAESAAAAETATAAETGTAAESAAGQAPTPGPDYGTLDESYIRDAMEEIRPLLAECYELALEEAPELEGRLILNYTIGGEPEVGGVVEEVLINDESDLRHPILDECVRETVYTTELQAPEGGGRVNVTYPVYFAPDDPDAEEP